MFILGVGVVVIMLVMYEESDPLAGHGFERLKSKKEALHPSQNEMKSFCERVEKLFITLGIWRLG